MIQIYDIEDKILLQAETTSAAKREQEMSKSDYISLSFSTAEKVILPVGAYINYTYKIDKVREVTRKFLLLEAYEPTQTDEMSWKYTPEFQHPKMILSKTPFYIYIRNSQNEEIKQNVWSFVGITSVLSGKIADFLNKDLMFGKCGWKVIFQNVTANTINVSFSDNDFISALTAITNAIGDNCEWHIDYDDEIIYIGKVLIGATPVILEVGKNVGVPNISNSKESYYNAFSIFGGTRNITQVNSQGENISSSDIRLQLGEGNGTIIIDGEELSYTIDKYSTLDLRRDKTKEPLFTKVLDFSDIFPSLNTYVYDVRGRVKYVLDKKNNKIPIAGSTNEYKTFTVWYMRLAYPATKKITGKTIINTTVDDGVTHYWYDFEVTDDLLINGKNIGCSFEPNFNTGALSTPLAGRGSNGDYVGFELIYHKDAISSHTSDDVDKNPFSIKKGDYEIIYQEDNDIIIPTNAAEMLIPRGESKPSLRCNITVLYNIAMADTIYYKDAQNRLLEKAKEEIVRLLSDLNNYEIKSYSDVFLKENPELQIGQSVTYKDGHGYELATRVLKLSTNIDFGFIQTITLGNQVIKGTITQLKEDVQSIIASGGSNGNGGGFTVSQLRNLIAKYGSDNFISKQFDDTAQGLITFLKGLKAQDVIKAINGMSLGNGENYVNGNGDANLSDVVVDRIHDKNSTPSDRTIIGAQGFDLYMGDDGKSHLFVDYLTARTRMFASSVEIRKVSYSGGTTIFSNAGSQIAKVSYIYDAAKEKVIAYKCYAVADDGTTKTMNWWHVGMMALCQTFNVKAGEGKNLENRYYWRMVVGVGQEKLDGKLYDYVILSNIKEFQGNLLTIPTYSDKTLANEQKKKLVWGNVMVEVTMDEGMQTLASLFAEQEGTDVDDNGTKIADRIFYGYDGEKPDAPAPYDVIVQVGDQIKWKKYGNVIKLSTSTEDSATDNDNAPAITMYHKLGAPHYTGSLDTNDNKIVNPYQWKIITTIISPEKVMHNTDNFQLFQGTPDNIIDPITIMYDIVPSVAYYTRHPSTQTTTPADITFSLRKRTGNKVETLTDAQIYAEYTLLDGSSNTKLLTNKALSDIGNLYQITSVKIKSTIKEADHEDIVVTYDLPVLTDGVKGDQGAAGKDGAPGANGKDGVDGKDGEDAINIVVNSVPVVFNTEDNGLVEDGAAGYASVYVYQKKENISSQVENIAVYRTENCKCEVAYDSEQNYLRVKISNVAKEDITVDGATTQISKTAGYATISFSYNGVMYYQQVQFVVNVSKFNSTVIQTTKKYEQKYTEVSNQIDTLSTDVNNLDSNLGNLRNDVDSLDQQVEAIPLRSDQDLTTFESKITQTARNISLSLTEQAVSRRNLLVNSDFARNGGFYTTLIAKATMERLSGYKNSNCCHLMPTSTSQYPVLRWEGVNSACNNIPIVGGKKYTISCWAKVSNTAAPLYINVFGQEKITGNVTTGTILDEFVELNSANTWQLVSFTFVAPGGYSYCSVRLSFRPKTNTRIDGYVCRPMFEQSDSYNGWTLSENDYDYRGGNMLDNTRYLNTGGNLSQVGTLTGNAKDGCSLSEATVQQNKSATLVRFDNVSVVANTDYVLSFFIRSKVLSSKTNVVCTLNLVTNVKFAECNSGSVSSYTSANGNSTTSGYIELGNIPTEWTKVWYHFSPKNTYTNQAIAIQIYGRNGVGTLQISQPKLEEGVNNTPWTEATEDVANKAALKRTGIDIELGKIILNAENTVITGDLQLKGILIENSAEITYDPQQPIICDMVHHKSVSFRTWEVVNNHPEFLSGIDINPYVALPMINDVILSATDAHKELTVHGIEESGMKLTISSQYNPLVAKWATGKKYQYNDRYSMENQAGTPYAFLHRAVVVVLADPRLASVNNYNTSNAGRVHPQGGGAPPFFGDAKYDGGCFVCNGRRSRMLLLMPGQSLHLTSSIERIGNSDVVVWYIDNSNDFVPISKTVSISAQYINGSDGYEWGGVNEDKSFPDDRLNGSVGYRYEDVLLAPPQLSATYPEQLQSETLGTESKSEVPFNFNVF